MPDSPWKRTEEEMKTMRKRVIDGLRSMTKEQASFCAAFATILVLGGGVAAWSSGSCALGIIAQKATGGGACVCSNIICDIYDEYGDCVHWSCNGTESCSDGPKDYETNAGGCLGPNNQSTECHAQMYQWTENQYSTTGCGINSYGNNVGTCSGSVLANPWATDGWNGPQPCSEE